MTQKEFALKVFESMRDDRTALFNLVVANLVFEQAVKELLPKADFQGRYDAASGSEQARVALARIQDLDVLIQKIQKEGILP